MSTYQSVIHHSSSEALSAVLKTHCLRSGAVLLRTTPWKASNRQIRVRPNLESRYRTNERPRALLIRTCLVFLSNSPTAPKSTYAVAPSQRAPNRIAIEACPGFGSDTDAKSRELLIQTPKVPLTPRRTCPFSSLHAMTISPDLGTCSASTSEVQDSRDSCCKKQR